jgi:hypothetical protein
MSTIFLFISFLPSNPRPGAPDQGIPCRTSTIKKNLRRYTRKNVKRYARYIYQKECQKIYQIECQGRGGKDNSD